jgi:hypothetical protein
MEEQTAPHRFHFEVDIVFLIAFFDPTCPNQKHRSIQVLIKAVHGGGGKEGHAHCSQEGGFSEPAGQRTSRGHQCLSLNSFVAILINLVFVSLPIFSSNPILHSPVVWRLEA